MNYLAGQNVSDALPKPLPQTNFRDFVTQWLAAPVVCHLTAKEYAAASKKGQQAAKNTSYFCSCSLKGDGRRRTYNVEYCGLLTLDVDDPDDARRVLAADLDTLLPWNHCLWRTLTSTEENPRVRLIVDTEALTVEQYQAGVRWLGGLLGLSKITPESTNAVALWFRPTVFSDRLTDVPIVASRVTGQPISPQEWASAPLVDDTPLPTAPVENASLDQAGEMLTFLDPDAEGYQQWMRVGMALHHQFGDDALPLWDRWSARGAKYPGEQDIQDKWKSFHGADSPVTFRTIIKRAKGAGWTTENSRLKVEKRIELSATVDELLGPILQLIHASELSTADEDILLGLIRARAKDRHGVNLRTSTLRTALADLARKKRTTIPVEIQGFVYVAEAHQWVHPVKGVRMSPAAFDLRFNEILPSNRPSADALTSLGLQSVEREGYDPVRAGALIFTDDEGVETLNTYKASYPEADPSTAEEAARVFNAHLALLIPSPTSRNTLLEWMTWCLTHPGKKAAWCVFLQGAPGCGKSMIAEAFRVCFGVTNSRKVSNTMVSEKFNSWIQSTLFCFFEEILIGDRQKEIMEHLKDLITGSTSNIRAMRTDAVERPNMLNAMFLSNHLHGLRLDRSDRRFFCLACAQQHEHQVKAIPREHFAQLARLQTDLAGGFRWYLLHRPISPEFSPFSHAPHTPDRELVMRAGASEVDCAVTSAIESGEYDLITPAVLSSSALTAAVRSDVRYVTPKQIGRVLTESGWTRYGQRVLSSGERHCLWFNPVKLNGSTPLEWLNAVIEQKEMD